MSIQQYGGGLTNYNHHDHISRLQNYVASAIGKEATKAVKQYVNNAADSLYNTRGSQNLRKRSDMQRTSRSSRANSRRRRGNLRGSKKSVNKKYAWKETSGSGGGGNHNPKEYKYRHKKKRPKRTKRVPSNKTLAKKVKKLENKTKLSKLYITNKKGWTRHVVAQQSTKWYEELCSDAVQIQKYLSNVPFTSTNQAAEGSSQSIRSNRGRRATLIGASSNLSFSLSKEFKYEVKNMCTLPMDVAIYYCEVQQDCDPTPLEFMEAQDKGWRNVHFFNGETQWVNYNTTNALETGDGSGEKAPKDHNMAWPSQHKDLVNHWKPRRLYHGVIEPAGTAIVKASAGAFQYNAKKYLNWDAFAQSNQNNNYNKEYKDGFFLLRVQGIPVMDLTVADGNDAGGLSGGYLMSRLTKNIKISYRVPGAQMINHDYIDDAVLTNIASGVHPGRTIVDNADSVDPIPPPSGP